MTPRSSLQAAVALVNSAVEPDTLTTVAELDAFYAGYEYTGRHAARPGRARRRPRGPARRYARC